MPTYRILDSFVTGKGVFATGRGAETRLRVAVEGFPEWAIDLLVVATEIGPAITDLRVLPSAAPFETGLAGVAFGRSPGTAVPAAGIPARLVREINTGQLLALAQRHASALEELHHTQAGQTEPPKLAVFLEGLARHTVHAAGPPRRVGRKGNGIEHYLKWAVRYAEKVRVGAAHPIAELSAEFAEETGGAPTYVRDTIQDARRRYELLTSPGQGRAGGQLTEKALELASRVSD